MDVFLVLALQALRDLIGKPIKINSGFRCITHNRRVGGEEGSFHTLGKAVDIVVVGMSPREVAEFAGQIHAFRNGGIGYYPSWTHLDNRGKKARWVK